MKPGARYVLAAVLVCPMQIDLDTAFLHLETHRVVVCMPNPGAWSRA